MLPKQYDGFSRERKEERRDVTHREMGLLYFAWKTVQLLNQKALLSGSKNLIELVWKVENSHCCLSCPQGIRQLQAKTKQETRRGIRVKDR